MVLGVVQTCREQSNLTVHYELSCWFTSEDEDQSIDAEKAIFISCAVRLEWALRGRDYTTLFEPGSSYSRFHNSVEKQAEVALWRKGVSVDRFQAKNFRFVPRKKSLPYSYLWIPHYKTTEIRMGPAMELVRRWKEEGI
jgi:hypothetical protein